jgi:3-hydroxymyristoyl/3-hydroxydecanoyl-(acyl carrier protein) dehydratase
MSHHFRAFSFVDRITSVQPGVSIHGTYAIPSRLKEFSSSLVAEAAGQLAAWAAMAAVDFKARPVAGIAGLVEMLAPVQPGQTLELSANLESVDPEAAAYGAAVSVNGSPVLRLHHCVGPMLPVEDFDDPQALRERFALIRGDGATPGAFGDLPAMTLENLNGEPGQTTRARLQVPAEAPFFADHFPRRPVFPGSLLMQFKLQLVAQLAAQLPPPNGASGWKLESVADMKLRSFITPGEALELEAKLAAANGGTASVAVESRRGGKLAGAARVSLAAK